MRPFFEVYLMNDSKKRTKRKSVAKKTVTVNKVDLYQQITNRIIIALENGVAPWKKPWRRADGSYIAGLPLNASTGRQYSGINVLLLWMSAAEQGFRSSQWLTYRQAQEIGGQVRKGEKATLGVVYKDWRKQAEDSNGNRQYNADGEPVMETVPMIKALQLFNVEQCDGLPVHLTEEPPQSEPDICPVIAKRINAMLHSTGVKYQSLPQNRAFYQFSVDKIVTPMAEQFVTEADYWSTLLHELVHSTGHAKRLNREGITSSTRKFGDPVYAFEELIAEMGSAFLCAQLGIDGDVQHDSYVGSWLSILKSDKKALFRACRHARQASEYLLEHMQSEGLAA